MTSTSRVKKGPGRPQSTTPCINACDFDPTATRYRVRVGGGRCTARVAYDFGLTDRIRDLLSDALCFAARAWLPRTATV
jgi:hypothetical protein